MNIPKIALGTGGLMKGNNDIIDMLKTVKECKYGHIDTAHRYGNEIQIGKDVKALNWDNVFVTTKVQPLNMKYYTKESVMESVKAIGHINLVLLHGPVNRKVNAIAFKELIKMRDNGIIGAAGVSNFEINQLIELKKDTGEYPINNQIRVTPTYCDQELIDFCQSNGIQVSAFSPLGSYYRSNNELYMSTEQREYIDFLANKYKRIPSNIIFKWLLDKDINVVFQSRKPERIKSNFDIENFHLTKDEIAKINSFDKGIRLIEMKVPTEEELKKGSFIYR